MYSSRLMRNVLLAMVLVLVGAMAFGAGGQEQECAIERYRA